MRFVQLVLLAGAALAPATPVLAAETLNFGPPPAWVVPQAIPATKPTDAPVAMLLHDQQAMLEPGKISIYSELAFRVQKPEGLAAGNLSIAWNPATDTVTVNKVEIRRAGQVTNVLASGQTFTVLRRETNLETAMLDGTLTATIQPEGLQEGDVVVLATTTEHSDPVLKDHVETFFAPWDSAQIALAHARLAWPSALDIKIQTTGDLAKAQQGTRDAHKAYDLTMRDVEPTIAPKNAPVRYRIGRMGEVSDFRSWADAAALMSPLFRQAAMVPAAGPLRDEVEKIRKASSDPKLRAEQALQLVEQRVRYVALLMGQGSYVPASAEETWSRRFGDCKAKTALLLAILHELGIEAEPVLVNPQMGDAIADRLPMIALFNHVLVRARVGGKTYWLDGTRTGDTSLDGIDVPDFGWGLPLIENAQLVHMIPAPFQTPNQERHVEVDASGGVYAPAPITITELYRGDSAVELNLLYSALSVDQRAQVMREKARSYFDGFDVASSSYGLDKAKRVFTIAIGGRATLGWDDNGWLYVPTSGIAFKPDFDRPAGPLHDVPVAINHPRFIKDTATIKLPPGFFAQLRKLPEAVHETLAGVEYARTETVKDNTLIVESSERSVAPEVAYKEALTAAPRLKALEDDDVYLRTPDDYVPTDADLAGLGANQPATADQFFNRGRLYMKRQRYDEALADLTKAASLDPKDPWALANRGIVQVRKREYAAAEKDFNDAEALDPGNWVALQGRGILAEARNDCAKALGFYAKALAKEPSDTFTLARRAICLQSQGKAKESVVGLDEAIARSPDDPTLLANRAYANAMAGKLNEAERDLKAATALDPQLPGLFEVEGVIAEGRENYQAAVDAFTKALEAKPGEPFDLLHRAQAYARLGEDDKALADSEQVLKAHPDTPDLRVLRANIFLKRAQRDAVAKEVELLAKENPKSDYALVAAGKTYARLGMQAEAMRAFDQALAIKSEAYVYVNRAQSRPLNDHAGRLADLDKALKLEPGNAEALAEKAEQLAVTSDYKGALQLYDAAVEAAPDNTYLAIGRAMILYKAGNTVEAEKLLAARRASLKSATEFNNLCWSKATKNMMLESALQDCQEALRLKPDNGAALDSLALVKLRLGKFDEAISLYGQAIAKKTGSASYMGRAIAYARKGDKARSVADRAEAMKLDPDVETRFAEYGLKL